ncbi:RNA polymerase sigma-70 factor [Arachidicoccus ginsenosidimutans]|uniref:RNA polymerase sigma-70 factor n=1 Tax=Arachidicoccus sp. BS20 TaxID=1850526 RepID=UPI002100727E|nr:RNA polymerase sigma-70 factor [Arachidicoccus sp. BS20]
MRNHFDNNNWSEKEEAFNYNRDEAFGNLYRYYYAKMVNHAYSKINDAAAAEDIVQDIFLKLFLNKSEIKNVKRYLFVALRNRIYDFWRTELLHNKHTVIIRNGLAISSEHTWNDIVSKEMKEELDKHIQALPPQCREVFVLRREEQLSNKEIAEKLGISVNTVEQHMRKAIRILKTHYGYEMIAILLTLTIKL